MAHAVFFMQQVPDTVQAWPLTYQFWFEFSTRRANVMSMTTMAFYHTLSLLGWQLGTTCPLSKRASIGLSNQKFLHVKG
jgi:hypothetical protein